MKEIKEKLARSRGGHQKWKQGYLAVEPVVADWGTVDKEYRPTAMYTDGGGGGKDKGKKGKGRGKTAKAADSWFTLFT